MALHAGLFILLGYLLAFHRGLQVEAPREDPPLVVVDLPKPPLQPVQVQTATNVKPIVTREIDRFHPPQMITPLQLDDQSTVSTPKGPPTTAPTVIVNPTPIYRGGLVYPDRAAETNREGYVDFDFIIEPDGTVGNPVVVAEVPDGVGFAAAAKKAFPKWKFKPMMKDGVPVAAPAHIRVLFRLN
jgi:protein TonB